MEGVIISNVRESFRKVQPIAESVAGIFYSKLFKNDPSLRPLFKGDMKEQGIKLMKMLAIAVNSLGNMKALVPMLQDLGRRHVGYGVTSEMYNTVGDTLLETLEAALGPSFTQGIRHSWMQVYETVAAVMKEASV